MLGSRAAWALIGATAFTVGKRAMGSGLPKDFARLRINWRTGWDPLRGRGACDGGAGWPDGRGARGSSTVPATCAVPGVRKCPARLGVSFRASRLGFLAASGLPTGMASHTDTIRPPTFLAAVPGRFGVPARHGDASELPCRPVVPDWKRLSAPGGAGCPTRSA